MTLLLPLLLACGGKDDFDYHTGDFYVRALVDGVDYEGSSQGGTWLHDASGATELLMFPADPITGSFFDWAPGDTGELPLSDQEPLVSVMFYLEGSAAFTSASGVFEIETWEENPGFGGADPRLAVMGGTFEGSFRAVGEERTVEITEGEFFSLITDNSDAGG